jgi:hypothetical protein
MSAIRFLAPAEPPLAIIRFGLPPNCAMFSLIHLRYVETSTQYPSKREFIHLTGNA